MASASAPPAYVRSARRLSPPLLAYSICAHPGPILAAHQVVTGSKAKYSTKTYEKVPKPPAEPCGHRRRSTDLWVSGKGQGDAAWHQPEVRGRESAAHPVVEGEGSRHEPI